MRSSTDTEVPAYYDAGDRVSVKEREKQSKHRESMLLASLKEQMGTKQGRCWMFGLLATAGYYRSEFNGNSRDYHNLGARNSVHNVWMAIHMTCADEYLLMIKENLHVQPSV